MPTTTEVEARLRRTAQACEPLVADLVRDDPPAPVRTEHPRAAWLVAAAVVVVAMGVGALATIDEGGPADDVRTSAPETVDGAPASTDPRAAEDPLTASATLVDGTVVFLQIPGPERWTQVETLVEIEIGDDLIGASEGGEIVEARVVPSVAGGGEPLTEERRVSERVAIVVDSVRYLAVEGGLRTLLVPIAGLDDDQVERLGHGLRFDDEQDQLVTIRPSGVSLVALGARLDLDRFLPSPGLTVWRPAYGGQDPACDDPAARPRSVRCIDGRLRVVAGIEEAQVVLPGIEGEVGEGPVGQRIPLAFADGTRLVLTVSDAAPFSAGESTVDLALADRPGEPPLTFSLHRVTAQEWAEAEGATLEPAAGSDTWRADLGGHRTWLLVERDRWTAALLVSVEGEAVVPDDVVDLVASNLDLTGSSDGPVALGGPGLELASATRAVQAQMGFYPAGLSVEVGAVARAACAPGTSPPPDGRCLADGRVLVIAERLVETAGQPLAVDLDTVEVEVTEAPG